MKNRPKYIQYMVNRANEYFKFNNVNDEKKSDLYCFMCRLLLDKKCYEGFNYYFTKVIDGKECQVLCGTDDMDKCEYIQLY